MIQIEGHDNLFKASSGAIVRTDKDAVMRKVEQKRLEKKKFEALENKVDTLEAMLRQVLDKLDGNN